MNKYHNKKTIIDNIKFDSKAEAYRYKELKSLEKVGEITNLRLQPRYLLQEAYKLNGKAIRKIEYIADFEYIDSEGKTIVEDVKGIETDVFKLKRKLFLYRYKDVEFKIVK